MDRPAGGDTITQGVHLDPGGRGDVGGGDRAGALLELIAGSGERSENEAERAAWEAELIQILESDDQLAKKVLGVSDIAD